MSLLEPGSDSVDLSAPPRFGLGIFLSIAVSLSIEGTSTSRKFSGKRDVFMNSPPSLRCCSY